MKVFIRADMPEKKLQPFLQHIRNFDVANEDCHFEVLIDAPETPLSEMIDELQVEPKLTFTEILRRKKRDE